MKRLKQLLVIGLSLVMVIAFAACGGKSDSTKTLSSISVDSSAAKTEYTVGESFSSDGIVVTASYSDSSTATISSGNYTVDSSAYSSTTAGTYTITVSYTESSVTKTASYSVTVTASGSGDTGDTGGTGDTGDTGDQGGEVEVENYGGLYVTKTTTEYTVESAAGVTVSTDDISVYLVDGDQNVSETALSSSEYTLKYAKDGEFIESLENLTEGKYQIWVYVDNPYTTDPAQLSNFVFVNVTDEIASIALSNADTGTFEQKVSTTDSMTSTWEFTLTYASGLTETIYANDSNITISGVSTLTVAENAEATVTYTKTSATDGEKIVTCTVTYTITASTGETNTYEFSYTALTAAISAAGDTFTDSMSVKQSYLTNTDNSFLTVVDGGTVTVRDGSSTAKTCIEVRNQALTVTFVGTGSITISFSSTGGSNTSDIALMASDGTYIIADSDTDADSTGIYSVAGTSYITLTFTITDAGTYTIVGGINYGRNTRINAIIMTDIT